ncbi:MAG: potassium transporter TrkA [Cytophagales bacterium CG17_big_fil_post_rev_8_21_14_2_50_40_13]|nr:MAG: potassium transporter TrkA [Cytophagales bacterium CG17_big_fil_post_rev_8_21_14_2_50_40_13]
MKYIIIGLGNFGASLAEKLTRIGHEVIGVDNDMSKVEAVKEVITHSICLDCTDAHAVNHLPLNDTDAVLVCIGENQGANVMATALMKKMNVKRLISRAVSPLHQTILEAMGVDEIVHPEQESASRWAKRLNIAGVVDSFELNEEYSIVEAKAPAKFVGQTVLEIGFKKKYDVVVLTTIKQEVQKNMLGAKTTVMKVQGVASSKTVIEKDDIMVIYGNIKNIEKLLEE